MSSTEETFTYELCSNDYYQENHFGKSFGLGMPTTFFDRLTY